MTKETEKKFPDDLNESEVDAKERAKAASENADGENDESNPPRTTSQGWLTTPKFGSATSGGGEIEPGPERD